VERLKLVPAFAMDPPKIVEISVTGHEFIEPCER